MDKKEITASSPEEALTKASEALGVAPDQIKLTVLEETKGLFGKPSKIKFSAEVVAGKKPAKAKAKAEPETPAPVTEATEDAATPEKQAKSETSKPAKPAKKSATKAVVETVSTDGESTETPGEAPAKPEAPEVVATQEDADQLMSLLTNLLEKADMQATATVTALNGRYINVELDGDDVGYLVGRRGEVLNALQYLLNVISSRRVTQGVRVVLEGNNYRQRREQDLTQMAIQVATEVKKLGEEAVLDALPAFERRIIHQALVDYDGVSTYSEGEEPDRRVVITPDLP